jgi:hypothetical protein
MGEEKSRRGGLRLGPRPVALFVTFRNGGLLRKSDKHENE